MPGKVNTACAQCGRAFETWPSRLAKGESKYCSRLCRDLVPRPRADLAASFYPKVARIEGPGCWDWTASTKGNGYGQLNIFLPDGRRKVAWAHRIAWEIVAGPIPEGGKILHTCDRRICVRNDEPGIYLLNGVEYPRWGHLWLGTTKSNTEDMVAKGRGVYVPLRGEANGHTRLTEAQVREVKRLLAAGDRASDIACDLNIPPHSVYAIKYGNNWAHIE